MSDKHIVQKSGILANLLPGDIVMADWGFRIDEDVAFYQAKLVIPDFTRGKTTPPPRGREHAEDSERPHTC